MRAVIMASASFDTVMEPSSTWATKSFTRFLPRSRDSGSRASRPPSTIWSRILVCSTVCAAACGAAADFFASLTGLPLHFHPVAPLCQLVFIADAVAQHLFELVIALHA